MLQPYASPRPSLGKASGLLCVAAVWSALIAAAIRSAAELPLLGVLYPLVGAAFVVVGAVAWNRRPQNGTGVLLCGVGLLIIGASAGGADLSQPIPALGILLAETPIAATLHLVLAFPTGKVLNRFDRGLVLAVYVLVLLRQVPVAVPMPDFEGFRTFCSLSATAALLVAVVRLYGRLRRRGWQVRERRVLALVYGYGMALLLFFPFSARVLQPLFGFSATTLGGIQVAAFSALPFVFLAGLLRGGFARTHQLDEFAAWLGSGTPDAESLRGALAHVLGDPSLQVRFTRGRDSVPDAGQSVTEPGRGEVKVLGLGGADTGVRLGYDESLFADPVPVEQAGRVAAVALEREQLRVELLAEQEALRTSRARVVDVADQQRRRLAQDLHDVVQSRLTLTALHAGRLAAGAKDAHTAAELGQLRDEMDGLITEFRQIVHGVMPALLVERGLSAAVEDLVDRLPVPARLSVSGAHDLAPAVSTHSYFIVAEALTNSIRHAQASSIDVTVAQRGEQLLLLVQDDGVGGASPTGAGLRGIADRVEALEGTLRVDSAPGAGTRVEVLLPCGS